MTLWSHQDHGGLAALTALHGEMVPRFTWYQLRDRAGGLTLFLTLALPSGESRFVIDKLRRVSSGPDRNMLHQRKLAEGLRWRRAYASYHHA
jgi:hypothetical protein